MLTFSLLLLQFLLVRPTTVQSMIVGALIMMVISFIFIPNILCSLWVAFSIVSIETGVAGYMALWDIHLDSISMINLIMCIGFSVDFTAHICYAYMSSKKPTPDERVRECLYSLGLPIFQGAMSTILGIVALVLADSYIFLVFFKMVFMVIFFGAMHGLFLLPVLLSICGPGSCASPRKEERPELSEVEKTLPHPYCIPHPAVRTPAFGIPLPGLPPALDKDMGLGTSGEDSSEASSSKSQRRRPTVDDEDEKQRRRYLEGWGKSAAPTQFIHSRPVIGVYNNGGYLSDEDPHRKRSKSNGRSQFAPASPRSYRYVGEVKFP